MHSYSKKINKNISENEYCYPLSHLRSRLPLPVGYKQREVSLLLSLSLSVCLSH